MSVRKPGARPRRKAAAEPFAVLVGALRDLPPGGRLDACGLGGSRTAWLIARLLSEGAARGPVLAVASDEGAADRLAADLSFFLGAMRPPHDLRDLRAVVRLPADERLPYEDGPSDRTTLMSRMAALDQVRRGSVRALVTCARSLSQRLPPASVADAHGFTLRPGEAIGRDELARRLSLAGYQSTPLVEDPGAFALRGGIVDLWSPRHELPVRLELFGDEVDSIRTFDPETQRTRSPLDAVDVSPARQAILSPEAVRRATMKVRELAGDLALPTRSVSGLTGEIERGQAGMGLLPAFYEDGLVPLADWLEGFDLLVIDDPAACDEKLFEIHSRASSAYEAARGRGEVAFPPEAHLLDPDQAIGTLSRLRAIRLHELLIEEPGGRAIVFEHKPVDRPGHGGTGPEDVGTLLPFVEKIESWRRKRRTVALVAGSAGRADRLRRLFEEREVAIHSATGPLDLAKPESLGHSMVDLHLLVGELSEGFEDPKTRLVLLAEADLLGPRAHRRAQRPPTRRAEEAFTASFQDLSEGDLVVHIDHGIGRYKGLARLEVQGIAGDFLLIEYAAGDKVYLPVHRLGLVQRYVGAEAAGVRLDRLGSQSFALRKKKVKEELLKVAAELLDIYAARKAYPGTAFSEPDAIYREFESGFPYDETEDQERAVEEVLADMRRPEPMDRLVCGDVGYGKTEVAMRAAMKAVIDGKQVAVLVPTTVLAAQHEATFRERFESYPVIIETISRFLSPAKTREILHRAALGRVDILIGTHRLLSRDIELKDLGLLIIDEEQRFGVSQKERLKRLRRQVDVLTLTATPIPRTLHMSLSGIRDLSIIATPPPDRRSIRTFVSRFDGDTIREAVRREIERGGQVFFVHNRVKSIGAMKSYLRGLLPEARIVVAHGQMSERALERAMAVFVGREADVLLSSAIIESGLDMPSVNTILVGRADTFGLAQIYQLRGRVGRSSQRAYCYLLVPARRPMTLGARRRLAAIQQLTELGSGLRLATHDLEIRGAGNLLGKEQSGQVAAVGFDLYTELLDEAVRELKGEPPKEHLEPEVNLQVAAYLPDDYVADVHQRLLLYKRLSRTRDESDLADLRVEIIDRYGSLPVPAEQLLRARWIALGLQALGLAALDSGPGRLVLTPGPSPRIDPSAAMHRLGGRLAGLRLAAEKKIVQGIGAGATEEDILEAAEKLLSLLGALAADGASLG